MRHQLITALFMPSSMAWANESSISADVADAIQAGASTTGSLSVLASLAVLALPLVADGPAGSLEFVLVAILMIFDACNSLMYCFGRAFVSPDDADDEPTGACVFQGVVMQFCSMAGFLWICNFCIYLIRSVRSGGRDLLSEPATKAMLLPPLAVVLCLSLVSCAVLGGAGVFGNSTLWCWVYEADWGVWLYYFPLIIIWAFAIVSLGYVAWSVRSRVRIVLGERAASHKAPVRHPTTPTLPSHSRHPTHPAHEPPRRSFTAGHLHPALSFTGELSQQKRGVALPEWPAGAPGTAPIGRHTPAASASSTRAQHGAPPASPSTPNTALERSVEALGRTALRQLVG